MEFRCGWAYTNSGWGHYTWPVEQKGAGEAFFGAHYSHPERPYLSMPGTDDDGNKGYWINMTYLAEGNITVTIELKATLAKSKSPLLFATFIAPSDAHPADIVLTGQLAGGWQLLVPE